MDALKVLGVFIGGVLLAAGLARMSPPISGVLTGVGFLIMALSMLWVALTPWTRRPGDPDRPLH
jgi:hypothetical protein